MTACPEFHPVATGRPPAVGGVGVPVDRSIAIRKAVPLEASTRRWSRLASSEADDESSPRDGRGAGTLGIEYGSMPGHLVKLKGGS
jgi:hypothetical protein